MKTYGITARARDSGGLTAAVTILAHAAENTSFADGAANAPFGPANFPDLLKGFASRPPWRVAGVDYRVGPPSNQVFKPASQVTQIPGVDLTSSRVTINNNNTVIDGFDFGTRAIMVVGDNALVQNSNFSTIGTLHYVDQTKKLTVRACKITGRAGDWASVSFNCRELLLEYIFFDGAESDHIQLSGGVNASNVKFLCRYSYFQNAGFGGGHGDLVQTFNGGPNLEWRLLFNTTGPQKNTQGFMYEPDGSRAGDGAKLKGVGEIGWNTFTGGMNYYVGATYLDVHGHAQSFSIHDNYYDANAVAAFCRPGQVVPRDGSSITIFRDNVNMRNGTKPAAAND